MLFFCSDSTEILKKCTEVHKYNLRVSLIRKFIISCKMNNRTKLREGENQFKRNLNVNIMSMSIVSF